MKILRRSVSRSGNSRLWTHVSALLALVVVAASAGCGSDGSSGGGDVRDYSLDFFAQGAGRFGALQVEINHLGNSGGFLGRNDRVDCVPLVEAIVAANFVGERVAKVGFISLQGVPMPSPILRCGFRTDEELVPADFLIEVTDASDTDSKPLDPAPTVVVSSITER